MSPFLNSTVRFFRPRHRRVVLVLASVLLAGLFLAHASSHATAAEPAARTPAAPPAPKVTVAPVEEKLVTEYEEITGRVDAQETVELRARVSGHIASVHFQAGQVVRQGDVLFSIDPRWYQAQFDLARARAEVADRESQRAAELLAAKAISAEEADARRAHAAETRAAFELARLDLDYTAVRAPITGRVSRAFVTAGNLVSGAPGSATLLTTIVSIGDAFVYADMDEAMMLRFNRLARENRLVAPGGRVPVELQLADETGFPRRGYIESADNRLNSATGSLALRMVFPNSDQALVPGLFARVRVPVSAPERALLISERAIGTDQSQKFVLALGDDNTVVYRSVKLGAEADGKRIVRDGLRPGERIVVNGAQRIRPGMTVAPELAAAETPAPHAQRLATAE